MKESPATATLSPHKNAKNFSFLTQKRLLHVLVSIRFKEALQLLATLNYLTQHVKKFEFYVCNNVDFYGTLSKLLCISHGSLSFYDDTDQELGMSLTAFFLIIYNFLMINLTEEIYKHK